MDRRCLVSPLFLLLLATRSAALPYFPSDSGPIFHYTSGAVTIEGEATAFSRVRTVGGGTLWFANVEGFQVTAGGDVLKSDEGGSCSACPDPDITTFDPPYLLLDYPLTAGKTWITETMTHELWGTDDPVPVTVIGAVEGPATVTVPAGTFEVVKVRIYRQCAARPWLDRDFVYWLHPQLGPVNDLVSWEGVVPSQPTTWSDLKAVFR